MRSWLTGRLAATLEVMTKTWFITAASRGWLVPGAGRC